MVDVAVVVVVVLDESVELELELLEEEELLEDEESLDELLEEELLDDELLDDDDGSVGVTVSLQLATRAAVNSARAATGASSFRWREIMSNLLPVRTVDGDHTVCRDLAGMSSAAIKSRRTLVQPQVPRRSVA